MASETLQEQRNRVRLMALGVPSWDLSEKDCEALTAVLNELSEAKQEIERLNRALNMEAGNRDHFEEQINLIASLLGLDDEESEWTNSNDVGDRCRERVSAIVDERDRLIQVCNESNEVCTCGCPMSDHDYDEDGGPCCGEYDHDCVPTCLSTLKILDRLRSENEALKQEIKRLNGTDEDSATCGTCQAPLQIVRPGKYQCNWCEEMEMLKADRDKFRSMAVKLREALVMAYYGRPHLSIEDLLADTAGLEEK